MEFLDYDLSLGGAVSPAIIALYLCGGFIAKKYLKNKYINTTFLTLFLGLISSTAYVLLDKDLPLKVVFLSFAVAIMAYEWGLRFIVNMLKKKGVVTKEDMALIDNPNEPCSECPYLQISEYYNAVEVTKIEEVVLVDTDTLVYFNNTLYVPTVDNLDNWTLTPNYIGGKPPRKPVKTVV